jgi:hypothetical protein
VEFPRLITISEAALGVALAGTWYRVLRRHAAYPDWRRRASLVGLVLPTIALAVGLVLVAGAHFRFLEALDVAGPGGKWAVVGGRLWVWSLLSTGLLSFCGLILAAAGKGSPRIAAAAWSCVVLGAFFVNFVLAVNAFH